MKKSLLSLAVASCFISSSVYAEQYSHNFYIGGKSGWSSFHDGINQFDIEKNASMNGFSVNKNSIVSYGLFGGYKFNDYFGVEAGYEYFGRLKAYHSTNTSSGNEAFTHTIHGPTLALKGSYPVLPVLDLYAKAGAALVKSQYKLQSQTDPAVKVSRFDQSLLLGAGLEYAVIEELAMRLEYQWLNNIGKANGKILRHLDATDYRPDLGTVYVGLSYRFGQTPKADPEPLVISKNFAFNSDILFDFGKSNLIPSAMEVLNTASEQIQNVSLSNPEVTVSGYTDRIGSDDFNLKLSQSRADTVANYIISKGVNADTVKAVGYGKANSVTGSACDAIKNRNALIGCLSPDRRVELQVKGSKQVSM